jgi:hypothetical protein
MQTADSPGISWTASERLRIADPATPLQVTLPAPTSRLVVGAAADARKAEVSALPDGQPSPLTVAVKGDPAQPHYASFDLPEAVQRIEVRLSGPGDVFFVGYQV